MVAGDAARALGALGKRASPSVGALVKTLSHEDAYVRIYAAEAALVQGARRSLPLLRRFLSPGHEELHVATFEIIRRIGPPAIPLLVDLLGDEWVSIRRSAVDALVDLAPHTEWIQPALSRALRDNLLGRNNRHEIKE